MLFSFKNNASASLRGKSGRTVQSRINMHVYRQRKNRTGHGPVRFFAAFYLVQQRFICIFR